MAGRGPNRQFPTAYKIKAIKRVERGEGVLPVARELGISRKILHDWIKAWKTDGPDGLNRKRGPKPASAVTVHLIDKALDRLVFLRLRSAPGCPAENRHFL